MAPKVHAKTIKGASIAFGIMAVVALVAFVAIPGWNYLNNPANFLGNNTSLSEDLAKDKFYVEASQKLDLAKSLSANANVLAGIAAAGNGSPDVAKMAIQNATDAKSNADSVQQIVKLMSNKTEAQRMWELAAQYGRDATNATTKANSVTIPAVKQTTPEISALAVTSDNSSPARGYRRVTGTKAGNGSSKSGRGYRRVT